MLTYVAVESLTGVLSPCFPYGKHQAEYQSNFNAKYSSVILQLKYFNHSLGN